MEAEKNLSAEVQNFITLHVPPFNTNRPKIWFHLLKAIFSNRRITSQKIMSTQVVEALPSEITLEIEVILEHPPMEKQFNLLKEAILSRLERWDYAKLRELINNVSMGDRTPQLMRFIKSLLGRRHMDESIMQRLWFEKLPQSMLHTNGLLQREDTISARWTRRSDCRHLALETNGFSSLNGEPQGGWSSLTPIQKM